MIGFGLAALALLLLALLPVVVALRGSGPGVTPEDPRLAAYRARLREIDAEARDGVIAADQAESARREIEREMLSHVPAAPVSVAEVPARGPLVAVVVALGTGVLALGLYLTGGRPDLVDTDTGTIPAADVAAMIGKIRDHLQQNPDDAQGWEMLGRAYMAMGRYAEAVPTFERLLALTGDSDPNALVRYADALAMSAGGRLGGKPTELLDRALALEPGHRTALWLSGMAAVERGENAVAVNYWRTLLPLLQDPETKSEVVRLIEQAGGTVTEVSGPAAGSGIPVRVEIAPELRDRLPAGATLFISARAEAGPPMPLAVVKRTAAELPVDVTLDDSLAMAPELRLSQYAAVAITARVSETGRAERTSGDLIGEVTDIPTTGTSPVTLVIDSVVP